MRSLAFATLLALGPVASAGIFSPQEPCPFEVSAEGVAKPLPLNVFKLYLNERVAALQPTSPDFQSSIANAPTFKGLARQRLAGATRPPVRGELLSQSADLLRLGQYRPVIELLKPTLQDRSLDYRLLAHLSMAHAGLGDWDLAVKRNTDAVLDGEPPVELAGTKAEQLKWMLKVDKTYTRPWLLAMQRDANPQNRTTDPEPLPLFPSGLPPDAVPIAQQMVLWSPLDARLLWLLGSVHLARGDVREAFDILEQCRERKLTWPKFREQHARAEALYRALPKEAPDEALVPTPIPEPSPPPRGWDALFAVVDPLTFAVVLGVFALLASGIVALQIRKWRRRPHRGGLA